MSSIQGRMYCNRSSASVALDLMSHVNMGQKLNPYREYIQAFITRGYRFEARAESLPKNRLLIIVFSEVIKLEIEISLRDLDKNCATSFFSFEFYEWGKCHWCVQESLAGEGSVEQFFPRKTNKQHIKVAYIIKIFRHYSKIVL